MSTSNPDYPVRLDVDYPQGLSRLLIFVKWLLALPHFVALFVLAIGAWFAIIISFFAILFTGRIPEGLFNYLTGVLRWSARVSGYILLLTDVYPPFSLEDDPAYPVRLQIDYPQQIARWRPLIQWLLVIPAEIAAYVIFLVAYVAVFLAWFAILFTGRYPQGLFDVVRIGMRWQMRVSAFSYWMTEAYPPFIWG
jgi:Domain of unknown function (DUF4389)